MPTLTLRLQDVNQHPLDETVDVILRRQATGATTLVKAKAGKTLKIVELATDVYAVEVDPPSYLSVGAFAMVNPGGGELTITFPVDPRKVKNVIFPKFGALSPDAQRVLKATKGLADFPDLSGKKLYDKLAADKKAGFLNILAKSSWTALTNGRLVSSYFGPLLKLHGDRFLTIVPEDLKEEVRNSAAASLFREAPGQLHNPPNGFAHAGSFKSYDHYGNLQLTFFSNGGEFQADVDIDDADGLEHVFQVVRNELTNRETHPYDIHEILIRYQMLNPGYTLEV